MRKNFTIFMITLLVSLLSGTASAQRLAVKSNLLYDITSTINLGVEYEVAPRWTLEMSANYNPWSFSDNKKMKLWMLQPEARYWLCSGFSDHFFGAHLLPVRPVHLLMGNEVKEQYRQVVGQKGIPTYRLYPRS